MYSCNGQNGSLTLKNTQGFFGNNSAVPRTVPQYGCVVMEVEDWIGGINYPLVTLHCAAELARQS